jgi:triacylglycerol esterase/lipase EstA (alpha/beta hydrolase family)
VPPPPSGRGQLLLVEDGGALRWVLPISAHRGPPTESTESTFAVPIDVNGAAAARGPVGPAARRVLRLLTFALEDPIGGPVGDAYVRRWEEHHRPYGLRSFRPDDYRLAGGHALDANGIRMLGDGPALLLIHGTNALTHTGFGGLPYDVVRRLDERYAGRVAAFDHPSLSVDPAENARRLLAMIPADAELELDILAHSRGGLVARMLTERAADLGADLSQVRVRQVVFVATPNDGTPLADPRHLGSLVDAMTNLLDTVPDHPSSVATLAGVVSVVKQLAVGALGGLDGLLAMQRAASAADGFLAGLNRPRPVSARYRAVSADYEPTAGSGISRVAINAVIDRLFAYESNDLIVPTRSAYRWNGASAFPIAERVVLPAERGVDHSSFWTSSEVTKALDTWLAPDLLAAPGEHPMVHGPLSGDEPDPLADVDERLAAGDIDGVRAAIRALPERHRRDLEHEVGGLLVERFARGTEGPKAGRVFVLHGIMGSLLAAEGADADLDRIWISPLRLLGGGFARLRHPAAQPIRTVGLHRTYLPLLIGLDADFDVVPFAYDWRLGLDVAAEELAARIDGPAHLVAHSMGGLVCRMLRARHHAAWERLADGGDLAAGGTSWCAGWLGSTSATATPPSSRSSPASLACTSCSRRMTPAGRSTTPRPGGTGRSTRRCWRRPGRSASNWPRTASTASGCCTSPAAGTRRRPTCASTGRDGSASA